MSLPVASPALAAPSSFTTPGSYSWTVPDGVTSAHAVAVGAGGGGSGAVGGGGAEVTADLTVTKLVMPATSSHAASAWSDPVDLSATTSFKKGPQVTSSADGHKQVAVWTAHNGSQYVAQAATSGDAGASWSAPVDLSVGGVGTEAAAVQVTGSADGSTLTAVWMLSEGSGATIQSAASADAGATWSDPVDLSVSGDQAFVPQIASSADGSKLTVVWMNSDPFVPPFVPPFPTPAIQGATSADGGLSWSDPVQLSAGGPESDAYDPQVASSADGSRITAVWDRYDGSNFIVQARTSTNGGVTWSDSVDLSVAGAEAEAAQVTSSANGDQLTVVWKRKDGDDWVVQSASSSNGGASWSDPVDLSAAGEDASDPAATGSTNGNKVTAIWSRSDGANEIAQAATSTDGGATWSESASLSDAGEDSDDPQVTSTADGNTLTAVWDRDNGSIQATTSTNTGASWSQPVNLSDTPVANPQIASAENGSALSVVWQLYDNPDWVVQTASLTEPAFGVAPAAKAFDHVAVGSQSGPQTFTVTNNGNADLSISAADISGADNNQFSLSGQDCTTAPIPAGQTCTAELTFNPTTTGTKNATLTFTNNTSTSPDSVALTGTGTSAPGAPTKIRVDPGDGELKVSWSPPASDGGSPITGYTATATKATHTASVSAAAAAQSCSTDGARSCTIKGLTNGIAYDVKVVAFNSLTGGPPGESDASDGGGGSQTPEAKAPSAPLSATYQNLKKRRTLVRWAGSPNATGYKVRVNGRTKCKTGPKKSQCRIRRHWGRRARVKVFALGQGANSPATFAKFTKSKKAILFGTVHFTANSAKLTKRGRRSLRRFARVLAHQGFNQVTLDGYTAKAITGGSYKYRKRLSRARAIASKRVIRRKLRKMNVRMRITMRARAGFNPVGNNNTGKGKAKNRRATINIR